MGQLIRDCRDEAGVAKQRIGSCLVVQGQFAEQLTRLQDGLRQNNRAISDLHDDDVKTERSVSVLRRDISELEQEHSSVAKRVYELDDMISDVLDFLKPQNAEEGYIKLLACTWGTTEEEAMRRWKEPGCQIPFEPVPPPSQPPEYKPREKARDERQCGVATGTTETRGATANAGQSEEEQHPWCYDIFGEDPSDGGETKSYQEGKQERDPAERREDERASRTDWVEEEPPEPRDQEPDGRETEVSGVLPHLDECYDDPESFLKAVRPDLWDWLVGWLQQQQLEAVAVSAPEGDDDGAQSLKQLGYEQLDNSSGSGASTAFDGGGASTALDGGDDALDGGDSNPPKQGKESSSCEHPPKRLDSLSGGGAATVFGGEAPSGLEGGGEALSGSGGGRGDGGQHLGDEVPSGDGGNSSGQRAGGSSSVFAATEQHAATAQPLRA